jgi:hypothetical protein
MIYIKSTLAGIAALIIAGFLSLVFLVIKFRPTPGGTPGWDPISLMKSQIVWIVMLLVFGLAFYWEFQRASR